MLQAKLKNAVEKSELIQNQLDDALLQIEFLHRQADNQKYQESMTSTGEKSPSTVEPTVSATDLDELSEELIKVSRNKYDLQEKLKRVEKEAEASKERVLFLESEARRMGEELWIANERVANQGRELGDVHGQLSWLKSENERLSKEMEEEKRKAGGVDYSKYEEMSRAVDTLRVEKSKLEWNLGEVTQWWNDAKWRHESLLQFRDQAKNTLDGTFLIRKQPSDGRYKWRLAMWDENSPDDLKEYRRVWFETTAPEAKRVFLSATFVNWECALVCNKFDEANGKFGVWVDIPPGRYEFLFVVDGEWKTSELYPTVPNDFGSQNNWRYID
ncbi:unnamed protein product [Anisakis simplex]|uniref:AMPK1_CBM domain-containing protein n=1 Tax=Anisakis simplex TaxID=6269 RepID=A0A0M3K3F2_ANISI|nr:unnamed protein product [Anisakis simplex]